ncbi:MAG: UDP-3-O-(3-hydroxymyristoyl)glucosamine N-acyltransferase [Campylobacterales bacterium]
MNETKKLSSLAQEFDCELHGEDVEVVGLNSLEFAEVNELSFLTDKNSIQKAQNSKAKALISSSKEGLEGKSILLAKNPQLLMAKISATFVKKIDEMSLEAPSIGEDSEVSGAYISRGAKIGRRCKIYPTSFIGINCSIGDNCIIYPNVTILNNSIIGDNCIVHPGAVIGGDGYGYAHTQKGEHIKIHHFGNVVLEDGVEIGSNSTVDRSVFGSTLIKSGTKIDNLVMIAHNCLLGENCIIVSQVGISGSTKLGRNVIMGGQSATSGHLEIGNFATIAARGGVTKSLEGGKTYGGFPIMEHKDWLRHNVKIKKLMEDKK